MVGDPATVGESKVGEKRRRVGQDFEKPKRGTVSSGKCESVKVRERGEGFWAKRGSVTVGSVSGQGVIESPFGVQAQCKRSKIRPESLR